MQKTAVEEAKNDKFRPHGPLNEGAFEELLEQANRHHLFGVIHLTGDGDKRVTLTFVDGLIAVRPEPGSTDSLAAKSAMTELLHDLTKDGGYTGWYRCEPIIGDGGVQDLHRYKPLDLLATHTTGHPADDVQSSTDPAAGATTSTEGSSDEATTTTPPTSADATTSSPEPARIKAKPKSKADLSFNRKLEKALAKTGENPVEDSPRPVVHPRPKPEPRPVSAERRTPITEADIRAEPDRTLGAPRSPVGPLAVDGETTDNSTTDKSADNKNTADSATDSSDKDDGYPTGKGKPKRKARGRLIRGLGS